MHDYPSLSCLLHELLELDGPIDDDPGRYQHYRDSISFFRSSQSMRRHDWLHVASSLELPQRYQSATGHLCSSDS